LDFGPGRAEDQSSVSTRWSRSIPSRASAEGAPPLVEIYGRVDLAV
jgi:hypothetical protein